MDILTVPKRVVDLLMQIQKDGILKRASELQEVYRLIAAHSAVAQGEPVAWRHKWTNNHDAGWAYKEAGPTTDELRIGVPGILGHDSHRECWEPLYAHPRPMTDAARDAQDAVRYRLAVASLESERAAKGE